MNVNHHPYRITGTAMDPDNIVFVDRRKGNDRRYETDPCADIPLDLYHRKRRKSRERRDPTKTLSDDYYAYIQKVMIQIEDEQREASRLRRSKR